MAESANTFALARTAKLRISDSNDFETKVLSGTEQDGHYVLSVSGDDASHGWTYTFGLHDGAARPEFLTVGLSFTTAHHAMNLAAEMLCAGLDLSRGRHHEIVGEVDVLFRPVAPEWIKLTMNSAKWFNGSWDFPVLQLIYPDLEGRFQWEEGFNEYSQQPLLQSDAPRSEVEEAFAASLDPNRISADWPFADGKHTRAFLSKTVVAGEEPVTYVSHDLSDGAWQFLGDTMNAGGGPVLECLHHPVDRDPTLKELADLPRGWHAEREAVGMPWTRFENEPEEEEDESTN